MSVLLVRPTLSNFLETLLFKESYDLSWFQNGEVRHLTHSNRLNANELRL